MGITFICTGKPSNLYDSLYCDTRFIAGVQNGTLCVPEVGLLFNKTPESHPRWPRASEALALGRESSRTPTFLLTEMNARCILNCSSLLGSVLGVQTEVEGGTGSPSVSHVSVSHSSLSDSAASP